MKIALVQMEIKERDKSANVLHGLDLLEEGAKKSDVVIMPEIWTTGYSLGKLQEEAETFNSKLICDIQALAKKYNCNIIAGSIPMNIKGKIYNTSLIIDRNGEIIADYSKSYLFSLFREGDFFAPGNGLGQYKIDNIPSSSAICYDLRFPELFRKLALRGTLIFFVSAEWPSARGYAWRLLARARALENGTFVVANNCVGSFNGKPFYGHSMVVGPKGNVIGEAGATEEILRVEIDLKDIATARADINVLNDVRKDI